jgi:hypothetical protein
MTPRSCPACGVPLTRATSQCPACGVALGEDNRCARCIAVAPVFERTGRYVCSACGETRTCYQGTVVTTEAALLQAFENPVQASYRYAGAAAGMAVLVPLAILAVSGTGEAWAWLLSAASAALFVWTARRLLAMRQRARARRRYEIEQRIIGLAFRRDGLLSAPLVSDTLRISLFEAQELLDELARSGRARAEPSVDSPEVFYHFGEAKRTRGLRRTQP